MRRRARIDKNQPQIVEALRRIGATVNITSQIGGGFSDLVVSFRGEWYVIEIKDGDALPSQQQLTPDECEFILKQEAPVFVIRSVKEAIDLLTDENFKARLTRKFQNWRGARNDKP